MKITEEQLVKLQEFRNFFASANAALGEATIAYEGHKNNILKQVSEKESEFVMLKEALRDEYGDVNIDITTGEYSKVEANAELTKVEDDE